MLSTLLHADEFGIRLEMVGGLPLWEPSPVYKHQKAVDRIRASITTPPDTSATSPVCACVHTADVYVRFQDGSLKRPDVSIFCEEPNEEEEAIRQTPEAVIEVISKGYEAKDLEIGAPFYLAQGVRDVIVFNPYTLVVLHARPGGADRLVSPVELELACGCRCTV